MNTVVDSRVFTLRVLATRYLGSETMFEVLLHPTFPKSLSHGPPKLKLVDCYNLFL